MQVRISWHPSIHNKARSYGVRAASPAVDRERLTHHTHAARAQPQGQTRPLDARARRRRLGIISVAKLQQWETPWEVWDYVAVRWRVNTCL